MSIRNCSIGRKRPLRSQAEAFGLRATDYNRRAAQGLARARAIVGETKGAPFARRLRAKWGAPSDTSYNRWEAQKQEVPAWALIAAAELAGVTVEDLLQERATRPVLDRLEAQERKLEAIESAVLRLENLLAPAETTP